jgi:hypothetical protein
VACHQVILTQLLVSIRLRGFCTEGCEDSTWYHEAEESPLLEAVTREQLTKK